MHTITVKNIPPALYERLRQAARVNRRSINSEIIVCIERALQAQEVNPHAIIAGARKVREKTAHYIMTDEEFTQAKSEGRP